MGERCNFYVGQKVCYVGPDLSEAGYRLCLEVPEPEKVYTIRALTTGHTDDGIFGVGVYLVEVRNRESATKWDGVGEACWNSESFRPIEERKTDIGFAHEILRKVSEGSDADTFENCNAWC